MVNVEGRLQIDEERGVIYFFSKKDNANLLRIEGVPKVQKGYVIDIHLVAPGNEHHHRDPEHPWVDGAICAVKLMPRK